MVAEIAPLFIPGGMGPPELAIIPHHRSLALRGEQDPEAGTVDR